MFSKTIRRLAVRSAEEARATGFEVVEPMHMLAALARDPDDSAARILTAGGLDAKAVHDAIDQAEESALGAVGVSGRTVLDKLKIPATPRSARGRMGYAEPTKCVFERAASEAVRLGNRKIDGGHVVLALMLEDPACRALLNAHGVTPEAVEQHLDGTRSS